MKAQPMVMTHRERMLAAMRGQPVDRIPWAPRMDLWAIAQRARGTTPKRFAGLNTAEIADELGVACHAVRADYTRKREPADLALRCLGVDNHPDYPYRVELRKLPIDFRHGDGLYETTIRAPAGDVTMRLRVMPQMAADGVSLPFVEKYPIQTAADFEAVAQVYEHLEVIPQPEAYAAFHRRIGERGVAVANGTMGASPMHLLLHDVTAAEDFYVLYTEERDGLERLAVRMQPFYDAILDAVLSCQAEVFLWGVNYDRDTTWPPFFVEQIQPALRAVSRRAHAAGKLLLTHTDGENAGLIQHYPGCEFDVGESVCPAPMTSLSLARIRAGFGDRAAVWGGIPCVVLLDACADEAAFVAHMDRLFAELGSGERLILGVSDNVPPDVNLSRLQRVKDWIEAFGSVPHRSAG